MVRFLAAVALLLSPVFAAGSTERYVVALQPSARVDRAGALLRDIDAEPVGRGVVSFANLGAFAADLTDAEVKRLRRSPGVRYVERVAERHILSMASPAATNVLRNLDGQTIPAGLDLVRAREVWPVTRGEAINVAVVDTGVDYRHPDLVQAWAGGYNAIAQSDDPMDDHDHGTHVAGTIAASDDEIGVVGIAPKVRLWGVKALRQSGSGRTDHVTAAIDWIIGKKRAVGGNWIINLSFGSPEANTAEREAIARAIDEGILVVAGAGNDSADGDPAAVSYPAAYPGVLAVGAVDTSRRHASFSNQGPELAAVAPGVDVLSSVRLRAGLLTGVFTQAGTIGAIALQGSGSGAFAGSIVYCGIGRPQDFPAAVAGQIAVVRRGGGVTFAEKARRAQVAGASAVVIVDYPENELNYFSLFEDPDPGPSSLPWPLAIAVTNADGERLIAAAGAPIRVANVIDDYLVKSGTSMSSPHAAGVAALAWSVAPDARAADVIYAIRSTATDLGSPGIDPVYGHGLIDARKAAAVLNPAAFGAPPPPPSGRRTLRR